MKKFNKNSVLALSLAAASTIAIGGTVAYNALTHDDESAVNTYTVGEAVDIALNEYQRGEDGNGFVPFEQGKKLYPLVGSAQGEKDALGMPIADNYGDKVVTVKNTGDVAAKIRVYVAQPVALAGESMTAPSDDVVHWNWGNAGVKIGSTDNTEWEWENRSDTPDFVATIDGVEYLVTVFTTTKAIAPGAETDAVMNGVYLDANVDYDDGQWLKGDSVIDYDFSNGVHFPVYAEAIAEDAKFEDPATVFKNWATSVNAPVVAETIDDVNSALKTGENIVVVDDIATKANLVQNGGTIDGGGNTIDGTSNLTEGRSDCVITSTGGSISNLTVDGGFRGIGAGSSGKYKMSEDLYIDNVTVTGTTYGINIGGGNSKNLYVEDSTICNWNSYGGLGGASFTNCTFTSEGQYYAMQRISADATFTFTDCNFEQNIYKADSETEAPKYMLESYGNGTIVLENCYMDGVLITADNVNDFFAIADVTVVVK